MPRYQKPFHTQEARVYSRYILSSNPDWCV